MQKILVPAALLLLVLHFVKGQNSDAEKYLLPKNVFPLHYDLNLWPRIEAFDPSDENSFRYQGRNDITIQVAEDATLLDQIVLHREEPMILLNVTLNHGLDEIEAGLGPYDSQTQKQIIQLSEDLIPGEVYNLVIHFEGINNDDLSGFYRSSYEDSNDETRWLVTTQFEPLDARRAFPCFDEPSLKATFRLAIHVNLALAQEQNYQAFFNTAPESIQVSNESQLVVTQFETTDRKISTYLVAFIVSDFSVSEPVYFTSSFNGENATKPYRTIGQSKFFKDYPAYSLSQIAGPAALNVMTNLTGVGFGLRKEDAAGIPDFSAGAMENWGLVTFRETALFYNEFQDPVTRLQSVVEVVTHELAHQWFGDLVTLHWWSDLWLNEGFANFFEYHAANEFRVDGLDTSDWDLIGQQVTGSIQRSAMVADSVNSRSRPLTYDTYLPREISGLFDSMSYDKGAAVLRMIHNTIGKAAFYKGLNDYLSKFAESVGTPERLFASWDAALPGNVTELFTEWHSQAGYPLVTVRRNGGVLTLTQERFFSDGNSDSNRWNIPITYSSNLEPNFETTETTTFFRKTANNFLLNLVEANADWIVVNNQESGYYRVDYDDANWEALLDVINNQDTLQQIHPYNRAQIRDDYGVLAATGRKNITTFLRFLNSLKFERDLVAWRSGIRHLSRLISLYHDDEEVFPKLQLFVENVISPVLSEVGFNVLPTDSHTNRLLRREILDLCLDVNSKLCTISSKRKVHPDLRKAFYCSRMKKVEFELEKMLLNLKKADSSAKVDLLEAASCLTPTDFKTLLKNISLKDLKVVLKTAATKSSLAQMVFDHFQTYPSTLSLFGQREKDELLINLSDNLQAVPKSLNLMKISPEIIVRNSNWKKVSKELVLKTLEKLNTA